MACGGHLDLVRNPFNANTTVVILQITEMHSLTHSSKQAVGMTP